MKRNDEKIVKEILGTFRRVMASLESASKAIEKLFNELRIIDYVFTGGFGTIYHGYVRTTVDVDVIVSSNDFDKVFNDIDRLNTYGFEIGEEDGEICYKDGGTKVHFLVEESRYIKDPGHEVPKLSDLPRDKNSKYTDFETHLKLKSTRGIMQDIADIVELLKRKQISEKKLLSILKSMDEQQKKNFKKALQALKEEDTRYKDLKIE